MPLSLVAKAPAEITSRIMCMRKVFKHQIVEYVLTKLMVVQSTDHRSLEGNDNISSPKTDEICICRQPAVTEQSSRITASWAKCQYLMDIFFMHKGQRLDHVKANRKLRSGSLVESDCTTVRDRDAKFQDRYRPWHRTSPNLAAHSRLLLRPLAK